MALDEGALYRPFLTLSNGERTKALLSALFLRKHSFLLIDEPTNHLDMDSRKLVAQYLKRKNGFILVSHDRAFLDGCVDHILSLNKSGVDIVRGNFSVWWEEKQRRDNFELAQNERLGREIGRLRESSARAAGWSDKVEKSKKREPGGGMRIDKGFVGHKSAKMMKRSKSAEKRRNDMIDEKSSLLKNIESADALKITPRAYHSARLLSFDKISISYGDSAVCRDVSFTVDAGERLAICGGNGTGKSSVLQLILGAGISFTGSVHIASGLSISYVPQDAAFLTGGLKEYAAERKIDESLFKTILRKLDFSRAQFDKDMKDYSAGQKKKVLLAGSLCESAHVYVWDEPLNYIDILSRIQIEELILKYAPTMVFVEHDRAFTDNIATKKLCLS